MKPWKLHFEGGQYYIILDAEENVVLDGPYSECVTAITAVNSHKALVESVEKLLYAAGDRKRDTCFCSNGVTCMYCDARSALALAKGEK